MPEDKDDVIDADEVEVIFHLAALLEGEKAICGHRLDEWDQLTAVPEEVTCDTCLNLLKGDGQRSWALQIAQGTTGAYQKLLERRRAKVVDKATRALATQGRLARPVEIADVERGVGAIMPGHVASVFARVTNAAQTVIRMATGDEFIVQGTVEETLELIGWKPRKGPLDISRKRAREDAKGKEDA